jgi:hypothetical protein
MLKICEQKGVGDQFNAEQFYHLSLLMTVRLQFNHLLHLIVFSTVHPVLPVPLAKETLALSGSFSGTESVVLSRQNYLE